MVKYITSKHQIAWGLYRVVMPLEILPALKAAICNSVLITVLKDALWPRGGERRWQDVVVAI